MTNPFTALNDKSLFRLHKHLVKLVANEKGELKDERNKQGRIVQLSKMPWMLPHWEKALKYVNAEMQSRLNSNNQNLFA